MANNTLGTRLKSLVKLKGVTVIKFCDMIGLTPTNVYKYFNDKTVPSAVVLQKIIAEWPDVNIYWLLVGLGEPFANEGNTIFLPESNKEKKQLLERVSQLEEKLAERTKTVEFQEKTLDTIIAMLKDRGIDIYEKE